MNLKRIEELGAMDYYLDLKKYIESFINKNYPLTKEDMISIVNNKDSFNVSKKKEVYRVMMSELSSILETIMKRNEQFLKDISEGKNLKAEDVEQYKKNLFMYQQQILEALWQYNNNPNTIQTETIFENKEYLTDAIKSGVSGEALSSTLEDIVGKVEQTGKTPAQLKDTVEVITEMKSDIKNTNSLEYSSTLVKENSEKIKSALNEGLTSDEVVTSLTNSLNSSNTKKGKENLSFMTKLISKMKRKELTLSNNMEKGRQKIKI